MAVVLPRRALPPLSPNHCLVQSTFTTTPPTASRRMPRITLDSRADSSPSISPGSHKSCLSTKSGNPQGVDRTFPIFSKKGMLVIRNYTPSEGEPKVPITVTVDILPKDELAEDAHSQLKLRIVLGRTALPTSVRDLRSPQDCDVPQDKDGFRLRACANAPQFSDVRFPEHTRVPLTLQALTGESYIVDSVTFGTFTYWAPVIDTDAGLLHSSLSSSNGLKRPREDDDSTSPHVRPARSSDSSDKSTESSPRDKGCLSLMRTSAAPTDQRRGSSASYPATLEWVVNEKFTHPSTLDQKWSQHELRSGRRLVRFERWQEGCALRVSCRPISQDDYDEDDVVISCIYRKETRNCWFTSVDIIYLLERLVDNPFTVEEKNRIRRNLEGFKPSTVSKHKAGFESFFQRIMDFPPPKPRNIEKDVKVFPWQVLTAALDKIISKYSMFSLASSQAMNKEQTLSGSFSMQDMSESSAAMRASASATGEPALTFPEQDFSMSQHNAVAGMEETVIPLADDHPASTSNVLTYPVPLESETREAWQQWSHAPSAGSSRHTLNYAGAETYLLQPPAMSVPYNPFSNYYLHEARNMTLGQISLANHSQLSNGDDPASFGHLTPMTSSPSVAGLVSHGHAQSDTQMHSRRTSITSLADSSASDPTLTLHPSGSVPHASYGHGMLDTAFAGRDDDLYNSYAISTPFAFDDVIEDPRHI